VIPLNETMCHQNVSASSALNAYQINEFHSPPKLIQDYHMVKPSLNHQMHHMHQIYLVQNDLLNCHTSLEINLVRTMSSKAIF
jgi:hypothetical protein